MYAAIVNVPGYMSESEIPEFDTSGEAWAYLAEERRESEEIAEPDEELFSDTVDILDAYANTNHGPDVVYGETPGSESEHDLGLAYSVVRVDMLTEDMGIYRTQR